MSNYGLVCTAEMNIQIYNPSTQVFDTVLVSSGTIINLVAYDGISEFIPSPNTELKQILNTAAIGDMYEAP